MSATQFVEPSDLPKLVGYKHLFDAYGWPKRTIQEWVKARKFPKPCDLPGRANVWHLQDILDYLEQRRKGLVQSAVSNPDDLQPEQLDAIAAERIRETVSKAAGHPVDFRHIGIHYSPPVADEEVEKGRQRFIEEFEVQFSHLDREASLIVSAWLFPLLRPTITLRKAVRRHLNNPEQLRSLALEALDFERWARIDDELNKAATSGTLDEVTASLASELTEPK